MSEKNNIDKLFHEQLNSLQASANPKVWAAIENKIAPKKKKIIPFWWFSGIAGVLILGFLLFPFYNKQDGSSPNNSLENTFTTIEKETILENIDTTFKKNKEIENTQLVESEKQNRIEKKQKFINNRNIKSLKQEREISDKKIAMKEKVFPENLTEKETQENENKNYYQQKEQTVTGARRTKTEEQNQELYKTKPRESFIVDQENRLLKETEEKKKKGRKTWSITTNFALLNSGSFSNSSPFSENLVNSTEGQNSLGYGVQLGYKINKKWSIRSGVQLQELNYRSNNVFVTSSRSSIASINFDDIPNVSVQNVANFVQADAIASDGFQTETLRTNTAINGNLTQQFGYLEIPVEIKYMLNENTKLQTQLVGGFSSLFLTSNTILFNNTFSNRTGDASNLNSINFSGNLGVDFNYQFTKNWSFSVNPMLKTFLNTFSDDANEFSPFNLGVYSGVSYQF